MQYCSDQRKIKLLYLLCRLFREFRPTYTVFFACEYTVDNGTQT